MFIICLPRVKMTIAATRNVCSFKCSTAGSHHKNFVPPGFCAALCQPKSWINTEKHHGCLYRAWHISPLYPQRYEPLTRAPCCYNTTSIVTVTWKANPGNCSARMAQEIVTSVIRHKKKFLLSLSSWV